MSSARALELVLSFSEERHTLTAQEMVALTGTPLPSVYRYIALLRQMRLLVESDRGRYHLSARFISLARAAEAAETLIRLADPVMRRLAAETDETVLLVRRLGDAAVCVHRIGSTQQLRTSFEPGELLPLTRGASARLLLSFLPSKEREESIAALRKTDPATAERLVQQARETRTRGWTTSEQEVDHGIWAAASAVRDDTGSVIAALSMPCPLVRAPEHARENLLRQVCRAAAELSKILQRGR